MRDLAERLGVHHSWIGRIEQRELAELLEREHSFVWRIEKGERRLDLVEFLWVCQALKVCPEKIYEELMLEMNSLSFERE